MIKKILSLFLILIAVGAGLCSAQTAGKKYYLVDGLFFEGMPPCVSSDNVATFITHEDGVGHEVTELRLRKGFALPEDVRHSCRRGPWCGSLLDELPRRDGEEMADKRCRADFEEGRMDREGFPGF
mgnify:CR=1 FL=1